MISRLQQSYFFKALVFCLTWLMVYDNLAYACAGTASETQSEHLAPRSVLTTPLEAEYGVPERSPFPVSKIRGIQLQEGKAVSRFFSIPGNVCQRMAEWPAPVLRRAVCLFPFVFLLMLKSAVAAPPPQSFAERVSSFEQVVSYQMEERGNLEELKRDLSWQVTHNGDPAVRSAALKVLQQHWGAELDSFFEDGSQGNPLLKEILLARFHQNGDHDLMFLGKLVSRYVSSGEYQDSRREVVAMALGLVKSELLNRPDAFSALKSQDRSAWTQQMNLLVQVIRSEPGNSVVRSAAVNAFLSAFQSHAALADFILRCDESLSSHPDVFLPFGEGSESVVFLRHNLSDLKNQATEELKARIAHTHLQNRMHKKHLGSEGVEKVIEKFLGTGNQAYAARLMESVQNHRYPEVSLKRFFPDIHRLTESQFESTLREEKLRMDENQEVPGSSVSVKRVLDAQVTLGDVGSDYRERKDEALKLLKQSKAVTLLLASKDPRQRLEAREMIQSNFSALMQLYENENSSADEKEFALKRIETLLRSPSAEGFLQGIRTAKSNPAFREGLIRLLRHAAPGNMKEILLVLCFRSAPDWAELISFKKALLDEKSNLLDAADLPLANRVLENEIKRQIALSMLERTVGVEESNTGPILFHNQSYEIVQLRQMIETLQNPQSSVDALFSRDIRVEIEKEYRALMDSTPKASEARLLSLSKEGGLAWALGLAFVGWAGLWVSRKRKAGRRQSGGLPEGPAKKDGIVSRAEEAPSSPVESVENSGITGEEMVRIGEKIQKTPDKIRIQDAERLHGLVLHHVEDSLISAEVENSLLCAVSAFLLRQKNTDPEMRSSFEKTIRLLLHKIYEQKFKSSSSPEAMVAVSVQEEAPHFEGYSFFKRVFSVLSGEALLSEAWVAKIGGLDKNFAKLFSEKFQKTRKKMSRIILWGTLIQSLLVVIPALLMSFTALPMSLVAIWALVTAGAIFLEIWKTSEGENTSYEVDKTLGLLLTALASRHKLGGLPNTKNISQGLKARWDLIKILLSAIPVAAAILVLKPVFFPAFLLFYAVAMGLILYHVFHENGVAFALERYERAFDAHRSLWKMNDYLSKEYDLEDSSKASSEANEIYKKQSRRFILAMFVLIGVVVPLTSILLGVTMYGIALSGYLGFLLHSFNPIKRITKGLYHTRKLETMVEHVLRTDVHRWQTGWQQSRQGGDSANLLDHEDWEVTDLNLQEVSLFAPNADKEVLLNRQSASFSRKDVVLFAAYSGAGKSQTAKMLSFLRPHDGGEIWLRLRNKKTGEVLDTRASPENASLESLRRRVQYYNLLEADGEHSLRDLLLLNRGLSPTDWKKAGIELRQWQAVLKTRSLSREESARVSALNAELERWSHQVKEIEDAFLREHAHRPGAGVEENQAKMLDDFSPEELRQKFDLNLMQFSDGQRRRIKLALILDGHARHADFLILDEPFSNIQADQKMKVSRYLNQWKQKHQVGLVVMDHHPRSALIPTRVVSFSNGRLISYDHIQTQYGLKEILDRYVSNQEELNSVSLSGEMLEEIRHLTQGVAATEMPEAEAAPVPASGIPEKLSSTDPSDSDFSRRWNLLLEWGWFSQNPGVDVETLTEELRKPGAYWIEEVEPHSLAGQIRAFIVANTEAGSWSWAHFVEPGMLTPPSVPAKIEKKPVADIPAFLFSAEAMLQSPEEPGVLEMDPLQIPVYDHALLLRMRLDSLRDEASPEATVEFLSNSGNVFDRLLGELLNEMSQKPGFSLKTLTFSRVFPKWVRKARASYDPALQDFKNYYSSLDLRALTLEMDRSTKAGVNHVLDHCFESLYGKEKGKVARLAGFNLSDLFHVFETLKTNGIPTDASLSKAVFAFRWKTFEAKARILAKHRLPFNATHLRRVSLCRSDAENEAAAKALTLPPQQQEEKTPRPLSPTLRAPRAGFGSVAALGMALALPGLIGCTATPATEEQKTVPANLGGEEMKLWQSTQSEKKSPRDADAQTTSIPASLKILSPATTLRAEFGGTLERKAGNGQAVKKGEEIIRYTPDIGTLQDQLQEAGILYEQLKKKSAGKKIGTDLSQSEFEQLEMERDNAGSLLNALKEKQGRGVLRAPFDGVFYHQPLYHDKSTTPIHGDVFKRGADLGYLIPTETPERILELNVKTSDIQSLLKPGRETPTVDILMEGKTYEAKVKGSGVKQSPYNLDYVLETVIPGTSLTPGLSPEAKIVVQKPQPSKSGASHTSAGDATLVGLDGVAFYPEETLWRPQFGGFVDGIPEEAYQGMPSVRILDRMRVVNKTPNPSRAVHQRSKDFYRKQHQAFKELYGADGDKTVEVYKKYQQASAALATASYEHQQDRFDSKGREGWVISKIGVRNGEFVPASDRDSRGQPFLRMVNPHKVQVSAQIGADFPIPLQDIEFMILIGERIFSGKVVETSSNASQGITNLILEIENPDKSRVIDFEYESVKIKIKRKGAAPPPSQAPEKEEKGETGSKAPVESAPAKTGKRDTAPGGQGAAFLGLLPLWGKARPAREENASSAPENSLKDIYGIYAAYSLSRHFEKEDRDMNRKVAANLVRLLKKGHPLEKNSAGITLSLKELRMIWRTEGIPGVLRSLKNILPETLSVTVTVGLLGVLARSGKDEEPFDPNASAWSIPTDPLFERVKESNPEAVLYWLQHWLQWAPRKMALLHPDDKTSEVLLLEKNLCPLLIRWLDRRMDLLSPEISKLLRDERLEELLDWKERLIAFQAQIILNEEKIPVDAGGFLREKKPEAVREIFRKVEHALKQTSPLDARKELLDHASQNPEAYCLPEFRFAIACLKNGGFPGEFSIRQSANEHSSPNASFERAA